MGLLITDLATLIAPALLHGAHPGTQRLRIDPQLAANAPNSTPTPPGTAHPSLLIVPHQQADKSPHNQHVVPFNPEASRTLSPNSAARPWEQRAYTKSRITRIRLEWWAILGSNQ